VPAIDILTDQWPACFVRIDGDPTLADFEKYIGEFNRLHERRERFCIVSYIKSYGADRQIIARVGRWFKEVEPHIRSFWASNAMVSPSPGFRFVMSAVYLIKPLKVPNRVCATPDEAIHFTRSTWSGPGALGPIHWPF